MSFCAVLCRNPMILGAQRNAIMCENDGNCLVWTTMLCVQTDVSKFMLSDTIMPSTMMIHH